MGCCGSGSSEPKQNNNSSTLKGNHDKNISNSISDTPLSTTKNILVWGLVIVIIIGFLAMML